MVEELILKLFIEDNKAFTKFYKYVKLNYIKNNYTNLYKLFLVVNKYYTKYNKDNITKEELLTEYNVNYYLEDSERDEIESLIEDIRASAVGLSNSITELKEEQDINMWDEILEYLKEKKGVSKNG